MRVDVCGSLDTEENLRNAEALVREAHAAGAQVILLQELFAGLYFCQVCGMCLEASSFVCVRFAHQCLLCLTQEQDPKYYDWAHEIEGNPIIQRFAALARELKVVRGHLTPSMQWLLAGLYRPRRL